MDRASVQLGRNATAGFTRPVGFSVEMSSSMRLAEEVGDSHRGFESSSTHIAEVGAYAASTGTQVSIHASARNCQNAPPVRHCSHLLNSLGDLQSGRCVCPHRRLTD